MNKSITLNTEQARELFTQHPEYRTTLLSVFTDEELGIKKEWPKSWVDLKVISGLFVNKYSELERGCQLSTTNENKNVFADIKIVKSALAYAQLSQLSEKMNEDWKPNWLDNDECKYSVCYNYRSNQLSVMTHFCKNSNLIYFKTQEMAEFSIKYHKDLWEQFYMI